MPRGVNLLDEARLQGRLWRPGGLTNIVAQSENVTTSPWNSFFNGGGSASVAANSAAAPDGSVTAGLFTFNRTGSTDWAEQYQILTTAALTYTYVLWLKAFSATDVGSLVTMGLSTGAAFDIRGITNFALTERWVRCSITALMPAGTTSQTAFGYFNASDHPGSTTQTGQVKFYAAKPQLFVGSRPIPYLETGATGITTPTAGVVEAAKGEAYDLWKYGYQNQLGAGHIYRNRPPMIGC